MYLVFKLQVTLNTTSKQWFSGFISKTTPLQVCKGELICSLEETHIKYLLNNEFYMEQRCLQPLCQSNFSKSSANLTTLITESLCTEKLRWEAVMFSMERIHSYM
jgi:hypothetical protein